MGNDSRPAVHEVDPGAATQRVRPPGAGEWKPSGKRLKPSAPPPPVPELEEKPEPGPGKKFPCRNCGAELNYSPGVQSLKCEYCGYVEEIPQSAEDVQELPFAEHWEKGMTTAEVLAGAEAETRCGGCGAIVELPANVSADLCPFCGSVLDNPIEAPQPMMRPGGVLPFAVDDDSARTRFGEWVRSRWLAPNEFKKIAKLGKLSGLYVPYWTYDSMTFTFYTGQRGEHYWVTVGSGKNRRRVRKTRWYPASGNVNHFFDDVLVCGSRSLPGGLVEDLEPWDLKNSVSYEPAYLSGFRAERYQVDATEGFATARKIMDEEILRLVKRRIGGDVQRVHSVSTQCTGITFKLLLLPVWLSAYQFHKKVFRVLINARTGEVQGERPWSIVKITLLVIAILAVLIPLGFYFAQNMQ